MNRRFVPFMGLLPRTAGKAAIAAAFLSGTVAVGSLAAADEPTAQELLDQIQKLQQQVEQMQAKAGESPAPAAPAKDPAARVLDDAQGRAKPVLLLQGDPNPMTGGHDGKFVLRSADGDFELNPYFQFQARHVVNINNEDGDSFEDTDFGWEIRRMKIGFQGHAFSPDLMYHFNMAFQQDGGSAILQNAYIDYMPDRLWEGAPEGLGFRLGQFKDLTFFEESTSSSRQLAADRSLVNEELGGGNTDYIQGFGPRWQGERWNAALFYTDGANTDNTPYLDVMWDYGIAGRVDFRVMGDDDDAFKDFTALGTEENSARIGGGFHWSAEGDTRVFWHSVDAQYETEGGLGAFAAYYGRWAESGDDFDSFDVGGLVQVSQLIGDNGWEAFGRLDFVMFEDDVTLGADSEDFFTEFTAGVNKYWESHKVKMTIDIVYLPNGNPASSSSHTGIGLRANDGEFDDQVAIRGQFQLLL